MRTRGRLNEEDDEASRGVLLVLDKEDDEASMR